MYAEPDKVRDLAIKDRRQGLDFIGRKAKKKERKKKENKKIKWRRKRKRRKRKKKRKKKKENSTDIYHHPKFVIWFELKIDILFSNSVFFSWIMVLGLW